MIFQIGKFLIQKRKISMNSSQKTDSFSHTLTYNVNTNRENQMWQLVGKGTIYGNGVSTGDGRLYTYWIPEGIIPYNINR